MTSLFLDNKQHTPRARLPNDKTLQKIYTATRNSVNAVRWHQILSLFEESQAPDAMPTVLESHLEKLGLPAFLPELARLELAIHKAGKGATEVPIKIDRLSVNPTLELLQLSWKHLPTILRGGPHPGLEPEPGEAFVLVWRDPGTGHVRTRTASDEDLLVLKMVVEEIDPEEAAMVGGLPVGALDGAMDRAVFNGLLSSPPSRICRDPESFPLDEDTDERFLSSPFFTLQWHITQACDLHCKHCYDRSSRSFLKLDDALRILDDLRAFCRSRHVRGQVSFTGGNPLLYPHFMDVYRAASDRGLAIAILGNPSSRAQMEALLDIQRPVFFQMSLEGLREHNDEIRGPGNYDRVMEFLAVLRDLDITSMVMLTLTKDNMDQVLPLAERLRGLADHFNFNRLSMVGEGANLHLPSRDDYMAFLQAYSEAAEKNPIMGLKDNLLNLLRYQNGMELFGGCAGYGCSAAFNFMAVLSDGEVHACRKFPSLIGNLFEHSLAEIYDSALASRYRSGCEGCRTCPIRPVCGGCLAIARSFGLDIFKERDPYCFREMPGGRPGYSLTK